MENEKLYKNQIEEIEEQQGWVDHLKMQRQKMQLITKQFQAQGQQLNYFKQQLKEKTFKLGQLKEIKEKYQNLLINYQKIQYQNERLKVRCQTIQNKLQYKLNLHQQLEIVNLKEKLNTLSTTCSQQSIINQQIKKSLSLNKNQRKDTQNKLNFQIKSLKIALQEQKRSKKQIQNQCKQLVGHVSTLQKYLHNCQQFKLKVQQTNQQLQIQKQNLAQHLHSKMQEIILLKNQLNKLQLTNKKCKATFAINSQKKSISLQKLQQALRTNKLKIQQLNADLKISQQQKDVLYKKNEQLIKALKKKDIQLQHYEVVLQSRVKQLTQTKKSNQNRQADLKNMQGCYNQTQNMRKQLSNLRHETCLRKRTQLQRIDQLINSINIKKKNQNFEL